MLKRTAMIASFVTLALAPASLAQDHRAELGVSGAWTFSDGVTGNSVLALDGGLYNAIEPKDSFGYTLDLSFFVNENLQVGALFSQQMSTMQLTGSVSRDIGDWSVFNYHGIFTYNFGSSDAKARPYVFGGAGVTHYGSVDFNGLGGQPRSTGGESQFSTTWGLGVKVYPGKNVGLKLGARWTPTYIKSDSEGWWCDPYWGCYVVGDPQYSNQWEFSGGLTFRF